jgi:hypothetical protein
MLAEDELSDLARDIGEHGIRMPVTLLLDNHRLLLLDGRNRLDAAERAGVPVVDGRGNLVVRHEVITHHDKFDAWAFVASANLHRRHLNAEQRRDLTAKLLKEMPGRSDRATARLAGVSPTTVGKVRHDLEAAGRVSKLDTRTDAIGRQQPATKPVSDAADDPEAVGGVSKLDTRTDVIGRQQPPTKPVSDRMAAASARWERQIEHFARIDEAQAAAAAAGEPGFGEMAAIAVARSDVMVALTRLLHVDPDVDTTITEFLRALDHERTKIAVMPLIKRVTLVRGFLRALTLTLADLQPVR